MPVIGSPMASREAYRQFREGGADPAAASLTLTLAGIISTVTLATVATAAAVLSGSPAAAAGGLLAAIAMLAAAAAVAVELRSEKGRARLVRLIGMSLRCSQRVIRRPKGDADTLARAVLASVQRLQLGTFTLIRVLVSGLVNWWADVACLAFAGKCARRGSLPVRVRPKPACRPPRCHSLAVPANESPASGQPKCRSADRTSWRRCLRAVSGLVGGRTVTAAAGDVPSDQMV